MADSRAYYIKGDEPYLIDRKIQEIIAETESSGEQAEVVYLDADEMEAYDLALSLDFSPLFALSRVIILKNPVWLGTSNRVKRKAAEVLSVLQDYFQNDNSGQTLIISSMEKKSNNIVNKFLEKESRAVVVKALSQGELEKWIKQELTDKKLDIQPLALKKMINSGQDMYYLKNLIDKLALIMPGHQIKAAELEEHLDSRQEIKVFKLTDALMGKNLRASLQAYYRLQEQGEHNIFILYMISRQLFSLSKVKHYQEQGYNIKQIAQAVSQQEFAVRKMMDKTSHFSWQEIRALFKKLLETDISFKSEGKDSDILMETVIIEFCKQR